MVNTLYFLMSPSTHPNFTLWGVLRWKWRAHKRSPRSSLRKESVRPWKHILRQQDSPSQAQRASSPSSHPRLWPSGKAILGIWDHISIKTHLVFTHGQKPGTVWAEVDIVNLFLMCCKVMNLKSVINFNPWMLISVLVTSSLLHLVLSPRCDLTLARSGKLQTLRWPSSPPVANSFPCGEILTTFRIGTHLRRVVFLITSSR